MSRQYEAEGVYVYEYDELGINRRVYAVCNTEHAAERIASLLNKDSKEAAAWLAR